MNIFKPRFSATVRINGIVVEDFNELDDWLREYYPKSVTSSHRKIVSEKKRGTIDSPISDWDAIAIVGYFNAHWRFRKDEDLTHFILTHSDILVRYDYDLERRDKS